MLYIFSIFLSAFPESDSSHSNELFDKNENMKSECFTIFAILLTFLLFWMPYRFINCSNFLIAILYIFILSYFILSLYLAILIAILENHENKEHMFHNFLPIFLFFCCFVHCTVLLIFRFS